MRNLLISAAVAALCAACAPSTETSEVSVTETEIDVRAVTEADLLSTLPELSTSLQSGEISSVGLVNAYIARIETVDRSGPTLQSVLAINPDAISQAEASDARRASGEALGPLDGVPILLKDNIESLDPMPTTAGSTALTENVTGRDSPLVAGLRAQGAVILGKTNLSQWANIRSSDSSSGWTSLGGQVKNPHVLNRNPCGSSSGSGAAAAASLAAGTVGTETNGSIICPSNASGIVGFKPTVGLVSQEYIVPISFSQDTAGPMTKSVMGAAMMMNAMATGEGATDYVEALDANSLDGKRVGVARFSQGSNPLILERFNAGLAVLEAQGAVLVDIEEAELAPEFWPNALAVLMYELKHTMDEYLASTPEAVTTRSLADVIAFNEANAETELPHFGQDLFENAQARAPITDQAYLDARDLVQTATRENGIDALLAEFQVDMLVSPSGVIVMEHDYTKGDVWPDEWAGAGAYAAIAGYPHITVPAGTAEGVPLGFSIISSAGRDAEVLSWGYAFEQASQLRAEPQYLESVVVSTEVVAAADDEGAQE